MKNGVGLAIFGDHWPMGLMNCRFFIEFAGNSVFPRMQRLIAVSGLGEEL